LSLSAHAGIEQQQMIASKTERNKRTIMANTNRQVIYPA
jgi:hypothetical protein